VKSRLDALKEDMDDTLARADEAHAKGLWPFQERHGNNLSGWCLHGKGDTTALGIPRVALTWERRQMKASYTSMVGACQCAPLTSLSIYRLSKLNILVRVQSTGYNHTSVTA